MALRFINNRKVSSVNTLHFYALKFFLLAFAVISPELLLFMMIPLCFETIDFFLEMIKEHFLKFCIRRNI